MALRNVSQDRECALAHGPTLNRHTAPPLMVPKHQRLDPAPLPLPAGLREALRILPDDALCRLVAADALDDAGDELAAECFRWMAHAGRYPLKHGNGRGAWYAPHATYAVNECHTLPAPLFNRTALFRRITYRDCPQADAAAVAAWKAVGPRTRRRLLKLALSGGGETGNGD